MFGLDDAVVLAVKEVATHAIKEVAKQITKEVGKEVAKEIGNEAVNEIGKSTLAKAAESKSLLPQDVLNKPLGNGDLRAYYEQSAKDYKSVVDDKLNNNPFTNSTSNTNPDGSTTFKPADTECLEANSNCEVTVKGNEIIANTGGWSESGKEGLNGYLTEAPNKTYNLDNGVSQYKTDSASRVTDANLDYNKAKELPERNTQRDTATEKAVVENKDGYKGKDDGGHLFSREIGGANESINQVPMEREFQQHGEWRDYERREKDICDKAIEKGHKVDISRHLTYEGDCKRPETITATIKIDGCKVNCESFKNPVP